MTQPAHRCSIAYDGNWQPSAAALEADPSPNALQRGLEDLAQQLADLVDRPAEVTLVMPADFTAAVMRRDHSIDYHTDRGSGVVAARTMPLPDGRVDVVLGGSLILDTNAAGQNLLTAAGMPRLNQAAMPNMRRTINHEAQHVLMAQRGAGYESYDAATIAGQYPLYHYLIAAKMCDEHRAEYGALKISARELHTASTYRDVLSHTSKELAMAAFKFQRHGNNVAQLRNDALAACVPLWTAMAYWAARYRTGDVIAKASSTATSLGLWQRYVGPTWDSLVVALSHLPVADLAPGASGASQSQLQLAARGITDWIEESLQFIGFRHIGLEDAAYFYVDRHDFPH